MTSPIISSEVTFMAESLELAREGLYGTCPSPRVGCVLVNADGHVIGRGTTQRNGGAHAEIVALRDARHRGHLLAGSTAYVTLEPCSHQGRTGSCCDAMVEAGVVRVVASLADPNPLVSGLGFARLRAAGLLVDVGLGAEQSRELNVGFINRMMRGLPWVRMKVAASLDGITALYGGSSKWITGPEARADGHHWRARACAVLTGIGTVLADDPQLNVRDVITERQPPVVVLDSALQLPLDASIFKTKRAIYVYTAIENEPKRRMLEACGAMVIVLPSLEKKVDLFAMLRDLAKKGINEVHVEAGAVLNGALAREGLVDELLMYLAPKLLYAGRGMFISNALSDLSQAQMLEFHSLDRMGEDLRILARVRGN